MIPEKEGSPAGPPLPHLIRGRQTDRNKPAVGVRELRPGAVRRHKAAVAVTGARPQTTQPQQTPGTLPMQAPSTYSRTLNLQSCLAWLLASRHVRKAQTENYGAVGCRRSIDPCAAARGGFVVRLARWAPLFCMPTGRFGARSPEADRRRIDEPRRDDVVRASPHRPFVTPTACRPAACRASPHRPFVRSPRVRWAVCLRPGRAP